MIYLQLFYEFFKTGLFAVGGGLATLPFLYDMADRTGWFTRTQLADMLAVSESTPGPIGVNMATYVGYVTRGIPGAIVSTLGLVTPSVIVILMIAAFLKAFRHNRYVEAAFYGLRPASTAMVAAAFLGSLITIGFVLLIARRISSMAMLIVAGVMVGYICSAATNFLIAFADDQSIVNLHNWSLGSFSGSSWDDIAVIAVVVITVSACVSRCSPLPGR